MADGWLDRAPSPDRRIHGSGNAPALDARRWSERTGGLRLTRHYVKLPSQQLANLFTPNPTAATFVLQLLDRLVKRFFVFPGKALAVVQSCGMPARRATHPPVNHCTQRSFSGMILC